ncbi:hypothetical protein EON80_18185 [bacterium]|nr:MAG: hypothetical protein EON80_18185 [bacterium]
MIHEATEPALKTALDSLSEAENDERLRKDKKLVHAAIRNFRIGEDDFQTIKVQLRALGLITKNDKPRSVKDSGTYWTLTPYGDEVMTQLRAIRRNEDDSSASTEVVAGEDE